MATRAARLASKTIWALEDILARCASARMAWRQAHQRAVKGLDPLMLAALATLSDDLAEIESKARAARRGEYDGRRVE